MKTLQREPQPRVKDGLGTSGPVGGESRVEVSLSGMSRYIDLKSNFGFRKVFGDPLHKEFLIDLLGCLIPERRIRDLTYLDTVQAGLTGESRDAVFDVRCESEDGTEFVVEMQRRNQSSFMERTLFYSTFLLQEQLLKGGGAFHLSPIYVVGVLNFRLPHRREPDPYVARRVSGETGPVEPELPCRAAAGVPESEENDYLVSRYALRNDRDPVELMTDSLQFVFLELGRFVKGEEELETELDRWCYALRSLQDLEGRPAAFQRELYRRLFEVAEVARMPKDERTQYALQMDTKEDIERQIDFAVKEASRKALAEGEARGRAEGEARGVARGRAEGEARGRAEGEAFARHQVAANLRAMGLPEEQIAKAMRSPENEAE